MKFLYIPSEVLEALKNNATVAISISGGKDSQAVLKAVTNFIRFNGYTNKVIAIHADLGRAEWQETKGFCEKLCKDLGVELHTVRREKGDLVDRWQERMKTMEGNGKPFWSSAKSRYCTSDMKTQPIDKFLRRFDNVINITGVRAEESKSRALKPCVEIRQSITTRKRKALNWNAIHDWKIEDVYQSYGNDLNDLRLAREFYSATGKIDPLWKFHPAYAKGNDRLSCAICVLGSNNDIANGIKHNPELAKILIEMERKSGFTFKYKKSLESYPSV